MAREIVCFCMSVMKNEIEDAIRNKGCKCTEDIQDKTYAGTSCGNCLPRIDDVVDQILAEEPEA